MSRQTRLNLFNLVLFVLILSLCGGPAWNHPEFVIGMGVLELGVVMFGLVMFVRTLRRVW